MDPITPTPAPVLRLFIGGPRHGAMVEVTDEEVFRVPVSGLGARDQGTGVPLLGQTVTYVRRKLQTPRPDGTLATRTVYVDATLSQQTALVALGDFLTQMWLLASDEP